MGWYIYVLKDPRTGLVRYVGYSKVAPETRLKRHLETARYVAYQEHRARWIRCLVAVGLQPIIKVIEPGTQDVCHKDREKHWIAHYRAIMGPELTNSTDGGDGVLNPTPETRQKMAAAKLGKKRGPMSEATRAAISASKVGRAMPDHVREALRVSNLGRVRQCKPETRAKIKAALTGHVVSAETRVKIGLSGIGRVSPMKGVERHDLRGVPRTQEVKDKISAAKRARRLGKE